MLADLDPRRATLLVQDGQASADAAALTRVLDLAGVVPDPPRPPGRRRSLPAREVLPGQLRRSGRSLQGSPNLSQVAMLLPMGPGNLEVANLLVGRPRRIRPPGGRSRR